MGARATSTCRAQSAEGGAQARVLLDNLPGYPDNVMRGRDGRLWVGLFGPRNPAADSLAERPFLRKVLLRLPRFLLPLGEPYGHVFAIDEEGRVTDDLQDPSGAYRHDGSDRNRGPALHPQLAGARAGLAAAIALRIKSSSPARRKVHDGGRDQLSRRLRRGDIDRHTPDRRRLDVDGGLRRAARTGPIDGPVHLHSHRDFVQTFGSGSPPSHAGPCRPLVL